MINKPILWIFVLVVGVILISVSLLGGSNNGDNTPSPTPQVTPSSTTTASPSPTNTTRARATSTPSLSTPGPGQGIVQTPVPRVLITGPAHCTLEGRIVFQSQNTYITEGAKMKFWNVDDSARLINWTYSPNDGVFTAGPNIFANIRTLPNGELTVGATWQPNKTPTVKTYQLNAKITYGVYDSQGIETGTREASCSGSITVTTP